MRLSTHSDMMIENWKHKFGGKCRTDTPDINLLCLYLLGCCLYLLVGKGAFIFPDEMKEIICWNRTYLHAFATA